MRSAESLRLFGRADEHAAVIARVLPEEGYDTYGRADVWRDLAWWHAARDEAIGGTRDEARRCAREAQALALRFGYHEIAFEMDTLLAQLHGAAREVPAVSRLGAIAERIVTDVAALPLTGELLLALT
jgi:hypothetical protein